MYHRDDPGNPIETGPRAVAKENYLYVAENEDIEIPDMVERILTKVEAPYTRICNKLCYGVDVGIRPVPSEREWYELALFVAVQQLRTPYQRDFMEWTMKFMLATKLRGELVDLDHFCRYYEELTGNELSREAAKDVREAFDRGGIDVEIPREYWHALFLKAALEAADHICEVPCQVVEAPDGVEFPTSDHPVVLVQREVGGLDYSLGGGWALPDVEATLTLSPEHVLVFRPAGANDPHIGCPEWAETVVERTLRHSDRFVFARNRDPSYPRILNEEPALSSVVGFRGSEVAMEEHPFAVAKKFVEERPEGVDSEILRFTPGDELP